MSEELQQIEAQRQELLTRLRAAEENIRAGLRHTHGFGTTARAHMERAQAHINEACIAISETKGIRSVAQLVDDLVRVEEVMDQVKQRQSHRI